MIGWRWSFIGGLAVLSGAALGGARLGAPACARWLCWTEPAPRADLLVVVAGGARERLVGAARLFEQGSAPLLLVTNYGEQPTVAGVLSDLGIPPDRLIRCPGAVSSTREDALCIRSVLEKHGFASAIVVTSPYHCRRLRLILDRTLRGLPVKVAVVPSPSLYWKPEDWWRQPNGWIVPVELLKLGWAWVTVPEGHTVVTNGPEPLDSTGSSAYIPASH